MYALNSFLRVARFVSNSFIGLVVGYALGIMFPLQSVIEFLTAYK